MIISQFKRVLFIPTTSCFLDRAMTRLRISPFANKNCKAVCHVALSTLFNHESNHQIIIIECELKMKTKWRCIDKTKWKSIMMSKFPSWLTIASRFKTQLVGGLHAYIWTSTIFHKIYWDSFKLCLFVNL